MISDSGRGTEFREVEVASSNEHHLASFGYERLAPTRTDWRRTARLTLAVFGVLSLNQKETATP